MSDPDWQEDLHRFHRLIVVLNERFERYLRGVLARQGLELTLRQWHALAVLAEKAPVSQRSLGEALEQLPSSVSGTVDHLTRLGLVVRRPHEVDRRSVELELSERGAALVAQVRARFEEDATELEVHYPVGTLGEVNRLLTVILGVGPEFPSERMRTARQEKERFNK